MRFWNKKSLKIPKEQSESVNRRRTDNTMAKRKSTRGQSTIYNLLTVCGRTRHYLEDTKGEKQNS
jgi:hypothetical protein